MKDSDEALEQSPNFFGEPKTPEGIRRINWRLMGLVGAILVVLFGIPVAYTYYDRFNPNYGSGSSNEEPIRITEVATSPVKRPEQEAQVRRVVLPPAQPAPVPMTGGMSEAEAKAREKKAADLEAAMNAPGRVENTASKQTMPQQRQQPQQPHNVAMMPPPPGMPRLVQPQGMPGDMEYGSQGDVNQQGQKQAFLNASNDNSPYLKNTRMAPLGITEVKTGSIIPGVMITGINSDLPGQITGQVRQNVYDSATGRFILIPAGARLVGTYDSGISAGQERVLVAWNDIIFPDGSRLSLDTMPGADKSGIAGMKDKVDNHYVRTFGQAFLLSLFSAGAQLSQTRGSVNGSFSASQIMAAAIGMQAYSLGSQLIRRGLNIQPTLEISPGMEFSIMVTKDIILPPWRGHPMAQVRNE